jgi:hypothetical protein
MNAKSMVNALIVGLGLTLAPMLARADETVTVGGVSAVLIKPAKPRGSAILMAGGNGYLGIAADGQITQLRGNSLVKTRESFAGRGLAVLLPDPGVDLAAAVDYMAKIKRPVTLIGTSRGTQRIARGLAAGARPDRVVLTSGFLSDASGSSDNVISILGSPAALPPTLVVHHRRDGCRMTNPEGVAPFLAWAGSKTRVTWVDGGSDSGDPCQAGGHHGFTGVEGAMVSAAAGFAAR